MFIQMVRIVFEPKGGVIRDDKDNAICSFHMKLKTSIMIEILPRRGTPANKTTQIGSFSSHLMKSRLQFPIAIIFDPHQLYVTRKVVS